MEGEKTTPYAQRKRKDEGKRNPTPLHLIDRIKMRLGRPTREGGKEGLRAEEAFRFTPQLQLRRKWNPNSNQNRGKLRDTT